MACEDLTSAGRHANRPPPTHALMNIWVKQQPAMIIYTKNSQLVKQCSSVTWREMILFNVVTVQWDERLAEKTLINHLQERTTLIFVIRPVALVCSV